MAQPARAAAPNKRKADRSPRRDEPDREHDPRPSAQSQACARSRLTNLCGKLTAPVPMAKGSITYELEEVDGKHRAIVTLACLGDEMYTGELCDNQRDAKDSAAEVALAAHAEEEAQLKEEQDAKKRKT